MSHAPSPAPATPARSNTLSLIGMGVVMIAILVGIVAWYATGPADMCNNIRWTQETIPAGQHADGHGGCVADYVPAYEPSARVVEKVGMTPTFHSFDGPDATNGCVVMNLGYKWKEYPRGGTIRIFQPNGLSHTDAPGIELPEMKFPPGTWRFCREDPAATGVEIWQ